MWARTRPEWNSELASASGPGALLAFRSMAKSMTAIKNTSSHGVACSDGPGGVWRV